MIRRRTLRPALSLAVALAVVAVAIACGGKADKTPVPESTPLTQPTSTPVATPTPVTEPTPAATAEPTAAPEPTATPQPAAEPVTLDELEIPDVVIEAGPLLGDLGGFSAGSVVIPTDLMGGLDLSGE